MAVLETQITVDLTPNDYWAFNRYYIKGSPKAKRNWYVKWGVPLIVAPVASWLITRDVAGMIVVFMFVAFAWCAVYFGTRHTILSGKYSYKGFLGRHDIRISAKDIVDSTPFSEERRVWSGIVDIAEDKEHIFVFSDPHAACIIPKRAFSSEAEAKKFFAEATWHWKSASKPAAPDVAL